MYCGEKAGRPPWEEDSRYIVVYILYTVHSPLYTMMKVPHTQLLYKVMTF